MHALPDRLHRAALTAALENPNRSSPYRRGVADVLALLGLRWGADEFSDLLLDSLRAHLADGVAATLDLPLLLGQIEAARVAAVENPTPARVVTVVQAVFKARIEGEDHYLMQYDDAAHQFQPIGGKVDAADSTPEMSLRREIMEELGLPALSGADELRLVPLTPDWQTTQISPTYGILTAYTFRFFHVKAARNRPRDNSDTIWLSKIDIQAGRTRDGRRVSSILADGPGWPVLDALHPLSE